MKKTLARRPFLLQTQTVRTLSITRLPGVAGGGYISTVQKDTAYPASCGNTCHCNNW